MNIVQSVPLLSSREKDVDRKTRRTHPKWRTSLLLLVGLAAAVLAMNTAFLAWAISTRGTRNGTGLLFEAPCEDTRKINIGIHLVINILSSMLLGASNYCMQCLSAPTRLELVTAHGRNWKWLDVGVPSLHNIMSSSFATRKKVCWLVLGLSSFPLHLCYNSAIFSTLSAPAYQVWQLGSSIKADLDQHKTSFVANHKSNNTYEPMTDQLIDVYEKFLSSGNFEKLNALDCLNEYSRPLQSTRSNVFLIPQPGFQSPDDLKYRHPEISIDQHADEASLGTSWIYNQFPYVYSKHGAKPDAYDQLLAQLQANVSKWKPMGAPIDYCLSETVNHNCKINFSVQLGIVVIVCNALKLVLMLSSLLVLRNDPLLTIGDAAESFLRIPEELTRKMCLKEQKSLSKASRGWSRIQHVSKYTSTKPRWINSVKRGKLITCAIAVCGGIITLLGLLIWAYTYIKSDKTFGSVLKIGLGRIYPQTIILHHYSSPFPTRGYSAVIANVFLANSPQVIISLIYFSYNATITSMVLAREWSGHYEKAKSLRVSANPSGQQRSTYFLQLPFRFAIPLLVFSCALHWLASQSIFLVSVEVYNMYGYHNPSGECWHLPDNEGWERGYCGKDFVTCGFSILGIFLSLIVACVLALGLIFLGKKKLNPMPVVGSCSLAIAASCHARPDEVTPWEKPVQWGAFNRPSAGSGIKHCGLSSEPVYKPVEGEFYE